MAMESEEMAIKGRGSGIGGGREVSKDRSRCVERRTGLGSGISSGSVGSDRSESSGLLISFPSLAPKSHPLRSG